jgi:hypothetical protein
VRYNESIHYRLLAAGMEDIIPGVLGSDIGKEKK